MARALKKGHPKGPIRRADGRPPGMPFLRASDLLTEPTEGVALGYDGIAFQAGLVGDIPAIQILFHPGAGTVCEALTKHLPVER